MILLCRDTGFTLAETAALLDTRGDADGRALVGRKLDQTRRRATDLERIAAWTMCCIARTPTSCSVVISELAATLAAHRRGGTGPGGDDERQAG